MAQWPSCNRTLPQHFQSIKVIISF
uniref:Uncharacterized protein n=1 Tax=Anguilla anguilla TaxID=7936 RepID=A0A0E9TRC4_ANGAN